MNGMFSPVVFYPAAVLMILFALMSIKFKNIFYSILCAILVFFFAGFFFYLLGSEYNAVIQIAIYGVAIPIVLGIAVMFTNLRSEDTTVEKTSNLKYVIFFAAGILISVLVYLTLISNLVNPIGFNISEIHGNAYTQVINAFSKGIFIKYVWAFELVSLILTLIVVGLVVISKKEDK